MNNSLNVDLSLLMEFLAPNKTEMFIDELRSRIDQQQINWEALLFQANLHACTPLWFKQLEKDRLLETLPDELSEYLARLYSLNLERNEQLQQGLFELLTVFNKHHIDSILLKGAATFCDHLFEPGTRVMGDLDILVPSDKVGLCQQLMNSIGYKAMYEIELENDLPANHRDHHIARHVKPNTPIVVEIHFKMSHGEAGRVFALDEVWSECKPISFNGARTAMLSPKHRVLLNTVHAIHSSREYLSGHISILQWLEFVYLVERFKDEFDWNEWFAVAKKHSFESMFTLYFYFALRYLNLTDNKQLSSSGFYLCFNVHRLKLISQFQYPAIKPSFLERSMLNMYKMGYYIGLTKWIWRNQCYTDNMTGLLERLLYCAKKIFSQHSRKIFWL